MVDQASLIEQRVSYRFWLELFFEWLTLRRTEEILHLPGVSEIMFFKKPQMWVEELRTGQRKGHCMGHCGTKTL